MINRVILVGRITKDPEIKYTESNIAFCNFDLAVTRTFTNAQGEKETDFIKCVVWRNQSENMAKFVSKGSLIGCEGRIATRNYQDQNGQTKYITEVVCDSIQFLDTKPSNNGGKIETSQGPVNEPIEESKGLDITDSELPF